MVKKVLTYHCQAVTSLVMGLYSRLFDYIVACINKLLSFSRVVYGESSTIGILDIFGFESLSGRNSFEQVTFLSLFPELENPN